MTNLAPVKRKTWEYAVNQVISGDITSTDGVSQDDRRNMLFAIKESLIDGGTFTVPWTVAQSSDSATADATDNWVDEDDVVWVTDTSGPIGSARSWIVLANSALGLWLLIDCGQRSSKRGNEFDAYIADTAYNVDGTTTTRPTNSGNEWQIANRLVNNEGNWCGTATTSISRTYILHVMMSDDGEETRVIITHNGLCQNVWVFGTFANPPVTHTHPWFATVNAQNNSDSTEFTTLTYWHESSLGFAYGADETDGQVEYLAAIPLPMNTTQEWSESMGQIPNSYDTRFQFAEIMFFSETSMWEAEHGILADVWIGPANVTHAKTWPGGSRTLIQFGDIVFPWNGTAPIPS